MTRDLIARLEKAESGSRELDLEIWGNHVAVPRSPRPWKLNVSPPAYTTSLDAIVALIGEKSPLRGPISLEMAGSGHCVIDHVDPCETGVSAWGNTPPLACCIALLKALNQGGA